MLAQGQIVFDFTSLFFPVLALVIIFLLREYFRQPKSSTIPNEERRDWTAERLPVMTPLKTVLTEGFHTVLVFLFVIPFYLYGGNVLYGQRLLSNPDETMAFIIRVAITVLIAEFFCNWIPRLASRSFWWRNKWVFVVLSGIVFSFLTYFVIPPPAHEGEALIGMGIVWVFSQVVVHQSFRILGWYRMKDGNDSRDITTSSILN